MFVLGLKVGAGLILAVLSVLAHHKELLLLPLLAPMNSSVLFHGFLLSDTLIVTFPVTFVKSASRESLQSKDVTARSPSTLIK